MDINIQEIFEKLESIKEEYSWVKGRLAGLKESKNTVS